MIRDSVELNVPEAVASADITEDYSVILSGTRDRMPRRGLDRNEGVVARKKWACIFRLDPRISFRTNEIYNISVNYSTSFVTEFYIKINEIDNSRNSLKNWKKSFLLSRIKYITISSREEEEISRSNSLRPLPWKHRQSSDNYVYTRWLGTGFKKADFGWLTWRGIACSRA